MIILPNLGDMDSTATWAMFVCLFVFAHSGYYGNVHRDVVQMVICGEKGDESESARLGSVSHFK